MTIETAQRLYELRKKNNLSQEELAEKLGVSRQAVSKWERGEASPDTDNLIALAKIYSLSIDELLFGGDAKDTESNGDRAEEKNARKSDADSADCQGNDAFVRIDDNGDEVSIGPKGVFIETNEGDRVKIDLRGLNINLSDDSKSKKRDNAEGASSSVNLEGGSGEGSVHINVGKKKKSLASRIMRNLPYPILCTALYIIFGCLDILGGFGKLWIIFLTIPLYHSLIDAISKKRLDEFAFPVFATLIYLVCGMYFGNWHPSWVIFLAIPIYYPIAEAIDRATHKYDGSEDSSDGDGEDCDDD